MSDFIESRQGGEGAEEASANVLPSSVTRTLAEFSETREAIKEKPYKVHDFNVFKDRRHKPNDVFLYRGMMSWR